ncbi:helix-turn-helix domain-containing protein [Kitasatospora acidiphila]|uniref:Helix-turn-helix domain-containing protein n=1 Tax=Kitasatospora acidiphila TaxID=2567942 RepID=A0A540W5S1_9ACTN|nr:helix-turn-helix transcriptional regulator [Kitasatospora acidiphila]TQF04371.1 helix-turn-helix domain-containing protein [Kitasatospora acidiphila]
MNIKKLDPSASSVAAFGNQLRKSRMEKGWTQVQLGRLLGCTGAHISGLETGAKSPSSQFAKKADDLFGTGLTFQILCRAIKDQVFLDGFTELSHEEVRAAEIRTFELNVIPGLFQTPQYAAALASTNVRHGTLTEAQARERLAFLENRQRQLITAATAPRFYAILDESCLRRMVGDPEVMDIQFDHLERLAMRPKVTIQAVPFSMGDFQPFNGPMVLLTMRDRSLLGYCESAARGYLERDLDLLKAWEVAYDQLQVNALGPGQTLDRIRTVRRELQHD